MWLQPEPHCRNLELLNRQGVVRTIVALPMGVTLLDCIHLNLPTEWMKFCAIRFEDLNSSVYSRLSKGS